MWIKASGRLTDHVVHATTPFSSHAVVYDDSLALIDTGVEAGVERLVEELSPFWQGDFTLSTIVLTHAHFDHIGGVPLLRLRFPEAQLVCSAATAEVLSDKAVLENAFNKNVAILSSLGMSPQLEKSAWLDAFRVDRVVSEGDKVKLGADAELKVIACPGHTRDCTGYYMKEDALLVAAEAVGGYNGRERSAPCFLSSYDDYIATLDKLLTLDVRILVLPHSGVLTGDLAKRHLQIGRGDAEAFVQYVKQRIEEGIIKEEIVIDLVGEWTVKGLSPEGPFVEEQRTAIEQMLAQVIADLHV